MVTSHCFVKRELCCVRTQNGNADDTYSAPYENGNGRAVDSIMLGEMRRIGNDDEILSSSSSRSTQGRYPQTFSACNPPASSSLVLTNPGAALR